MSFVTVTGSDVHAVTDDGADGAGDAGDGAGDTDGDASALGGDGDAGSVPPAQPTRPLATSRAAAATPAAFTRVGSPSLWRTFIEITPR
jgi:hypothetical protein